MTSSGTVSCCVMCPSVPLLVALPHILCQALQQSEQSHCSTEKNRGKNPVLKSSCIHPLPAVTQWYTHGGCQGTAHSASISGRKAFRFPAACVYFPSQIHILASSKRGGMSGTSAVTIWQKHHSIFWQLHQGLRTIISVPDSSTGDRRSSYISLQPSTLIQFSLSQPCWNFTLPH